MRETARSEYARDRWVIRVFALRAGELTGLGGDIFFLTVAEVLDALSGDEAATSCIPARQETYKKYKTLPPYPSVIRGRFDPFHGQRIPTGAVISLIPTPSFLHRSPMALTPTPSSVPPDPRVELRVLYAD